MVTEKDITNMGRKIKRCKNPKTLTRYQNQIDGWLAELEAIQARTQADILALEEKIKLEEEAKAHQANPSHDPETGKFAPVSAPESPTGEPTKKVAVKIAEKAGVSPRKCYSYDEFERFHLRRSRA